MKLGYMVFAGVCTVVGLVFQYGDLEADISPGRYHYRPVGEHWQDRQDTNAMRLSQFGQGDAIAEIFDELGDPDFSQTFDNDVRILMYRTRSETSDLLTTPDETAVLVFHEGQLIGKKDSNDWFGGSRASVDRVNYDEQQTANSRKIEQLATGESRSSIIEKLGRPDFVDYPSEGLEILSYRTRSVSLEGFTGRDETTPLLLEDGELLATGVAQDSLTET